MEAGTMTTRQSGNGVATRKMGHGGTATAQAEKPRKEFVPEPPPYSEPAASWFPVLDKERMDPEVRALLEKAEERLGFCPNVFRAWAWRPSRFLKWFAHYNELMTGPSG